MRRKKTGEERRRKRDQRNEIETVGIVLQTAAKQATDGKGAGRRGENISSIVDRTKSSVKESKKH